MKISYYIMRRYYISQRFFVTFRVPCAITFRENFNMRRYYISQRFFITLCVGITFRNDFFYYIMRRYYISQRFCITLCVGITFRNVYYILRFNTRSQMCMLQNVDIQKVILSVTASVRPAFHLTDGGTY